MYGAIIGDIVGSQFEGKPAPGKGFELFTPRCRFTDDTLMTLAIADAIMQTWHFILRLPSMETTEDVSPLDHPAFHETLAQYAIHCMQKLGRAYPDRSFGNKFIQWIFSDEPKPYNSYGNGSAMRVSPVAHIARTEEEVLALAKTVTEITHNHPEGIKGAQATALAIWYGLEYFDPGEVRYTPLMDFYPGFRHVFLTDLFNKSYPSDTSCQHTVPYALLAFFESDDFEGAIRNAISLGGDTDTLAAITGSIAETFFPVPPEFILSCYEYLDQPLIDILTRWDKFLKTLPRRENYDDSWVPEHIKSPKQALRLQRFHLELRYYYPSGTDKQAFIAETLTLDDDQNELSFTFNKPDLGDIQHTYHVNKGLDELFFTAQGLLKSDGWVDAPILTDQYFKRFFELTAKTKDGETFYHQGLLNRAHVPEWSWRAFSKSVARFVANQGFSSIFWEDDFLNAKKPGELMVCNVIFNSYGKSYQYLSDDESITPGDYVLVPVGLVQEEKAALVKSIRYYKMDDYTPYPLERTKKILRKLDEKELNRYELPDE